MDRETFDAGMSEPTPATRIGYFVGYFGVQLAGAVVTGAGWGVGLALAIYATARALHATGLVH